MVNLLIHFLNNAADDKDDVGVHIMKRNMLLSFNTRFTSMEANKLYALPTLLDPRFKAQTFLSSAAVVQARQCLIEEFLSFQSSLGCEEFSERDDSVSLKRHRSDTDPEEQSSLWSSYDAMMATGEEADVALIQSLSSAEVTAENYLQEAGSLVLVHTGKRNRYHTLYRQNWQ